MTTDDKAIEEKVRSAVYEVIEDLGVPKEKIHDSDDLTNDLRITSDDISFVFIPELERKLGVKIPAREWDNVGTIQETIDLLIKYVEKSQTGA